MIAIIAILASMLLPALNQAREKARGASCTNNLKQSMQGQIMYADANNGFYVIQLPTGGRGTYWRALCYGDDGTTRNAGFFPEKMLQCPSSTRSDKDSEEWFKWYGMPRQSSDWWDNREHNEKFGKYMFYNSIDGKDCFLLNTKIMKDPSGIFVFADTLNLDKKTPNYSFTWWTYDWTGGGIHLVHNGRAGIGFADGHAGMHSGEEMYAMPYNLRYWINADFTQTQK